MVIANVNSDHQAVIGGASKAVEQAMEAFQKAGYDVVAVTGQPRFPHHRLWRRPASRCGEVLERLHLQSPRLPIVANVNGEFYPSRAGCGAADAGHSCPAGRFSGAIREGSAHALRGRRARVCGSWAEESVAGICRGGAR